MAKALRSRDEEQESVLVQLRDLGEMLDKTGDHVGASQVALQALVLGPVNRDHRTYDSISAAIETLLDDTSVSSRWSIVIFWAQLARKTLTPEFLDVELPVFMRDKRWKPCSKSTDALETAVRLQTELARYEIDLFRLHCRAERGNKDAAAWDGLEECLLTLHDEMKKSDEADVVLYLLGQVVLTRLENDVPVRSEWTLDRYLDLMTALPAKKIARSLSVRSTLFLVAADLQREFASKKLSPRESPTLTTTMQGDILSPIDPVLHMLVYSQNASEENLGFVKASFPFDDMHVEYFACQHGEWFERKRFLNAVGRFERVLEPELSRLRHQHDVSPRLKRAQQSTGSLSAAEQSHRLSHVARDGEIVMLDRDATFSDDDEDGESSH